jgi:hypothetical protein
MSDVRRREFITLLGGAAGWPLAARTQQLKLAQIGVFVLTNADGQSLTRELRLGLRDLGYSEGQNFVFRLRSAGRWKRGIILHCVNDPQPEGHRCDRARIDRGAGRPFRAAGQGGARPDRVAHTNMRIALLREQARIWEDAARTVRGITIVTKSRARKKGG